MQSRPLLAAALAALLLGCESSAPVGERSTADAAAALDAPADRASPVATPLEAGTDTLVERLSAIDAAVTRWRTAAGLPGARAAAEEARNLIVGPAGPYYGDGDGNGTVAGASMAGLLPGLKGEAGLASGSRNICIARDVLGGDWSDPARRWAILDTAIADWRPGRNTFPSLPSHAQRIVGWATLTLAADKLPSAREYGRHAQIHADLSSRALSACRG